MTAEYLEPNRRNWEQLREFQERTAQRNWAATEPAWGLWKVPEAEVGSLPDVAGLDVLEAGCGTAYWSAWLARRGANVVGLDLTPSQLEIARQMQLEHALEFPLVEANAEETSFVDASFDLVFSEYGASIWCDPYLWIPEAARLLRPGGTLVYLTNGVLPTLTVHDEDEPSGERLVIDYFGLHALPFRDSTNFYLGYGDTIRLLRANGLEVEGLWEVQAPEDAEDRDGAPVTADWARRWPSEEIWKARKR